MDEANLYKLSSPVISPMCMYYLSNAVEGVTHGTMVAPIMVRTKESKNVFRCLEPASGYGGWYLKDQFFVINPMYRFIPYGTVLLCARQNKTWPYNMTEISQAYDPFHLEPMCSYFITWTLPVPYTTPLYIFKKGNNVIPSFDNTPPGSGWEKGSISPLFVLTKEPRKTTVLPKKGWFNIKDGVPQFKFTNYSGRCIPDPDGVTLEECTVKDNEKNIRPISLLDYLNKIKKIGEKKKKRIPKFFEKSHSLVVSIILVIFLSVLLGIIIYLFHKK